MGINPNMQASQDKESNDSYKYIETASDLNVEGKEFYLGDPINELFGPAIYKDKEHTELATVDELIHFYNTNDLILVGEYTEDEDSIPFRSRVNVIMDKSEGNIKACVLFYHLPDHVEGSSQSMELVSKCSIVGEETPNA